MGNLVVGHGRRLSSVPTRLSVAAATCFCSIFRNRRAPGKPSPWHRGVPNHGRFSIVVCVSRVLFSSSGGALVARFWEIWSLEMEGACRVCPRAYLLRLLRVCVHFPPIVAHPAHASEQSPIMVDVRSSFVCLGCSFLLVVARWWRVFEKLGRWRWKMLVECANAPV